MYKQYQRIAITEIRPITEKDTLVSLMNEGVVISHTNFMDGSPHTNDMIARNANDRSYKWLMSANYFKANFEPIGENNGK